MAQRRAQRAGWNHREILRPPLPPACKRGVVLGGTLDGDPPGGGSWPEGGTERRRVRTCVRMKALKKTNKSQHDEKRESLVISRIVRKTRGLGLGRLVFVGVCLVGTPGFEPGVTPRPGGLNTDNTTPSRSQAVQWPLVSCVSLRVRVPSAPPIHVSQRRSWESQNAALPLSAQRLRARLARSRIDASIDRPRSRTKTRTPPTAATTARSPPRAARSAP